MRLSSYPYTLDNLNYYIHLTNNAVQSSCSGYGALLHGNIFPISELEDHAKSQGKRNEPFMDQIKHTINKCFDAVYDILNPNHREHCFELFGFDFMVDQDFKVWLLECNSGPSLSESNKFLSDLIHRMLGISFLRQTICSRSLWTNFSLPRKSTPVSLGNYRHFQFKTTLRLLTFGKRSTTTNPRCTSSKRLNKPSMNYLLFSANREHSVCQHEVVAFPCFVWFQVSNEL